jgi:hypothetical protein
MPVYDYADPATGKIISVLVTLTEPDSARHTQVQDGVTYNRIYSAPLAAMDTQKGSMTQQDFNRVTQNKNLKVGDFWEISKEMSQDRADKNGGYDPVKEKFCEKHQKEYGKPHKDVIDRNVRQKTAKVMAEMGIKIED